MPYPEIERPSPNRGPETHERLGVLFHHSQMGFEDTITLMQNPASQVSYHCLIARDGTRCTLVPDTAVAWHAGQSRFMGRTRCNDFLLGLAFEGDTDVDPISDDQLASAVEWLSARWGPLGLSLDRLADHRQVSPGRKRDLNPAEWDRLVRAVAAHFGGSLPRPSFPS